jgi:hypothetical protein
VEAFSISLLVLAAVVIACAAAYAVYKLYRGQS